MIDPAAAAPCVAPPPVPQPGESTPRLAPGRSPRKRSRDQQSMDTSSSMGKRWSSLVTGLARAGAIGAGAGAGAGGAGSGSGSDGAARAGKRRKSCAMGGCRRRAKGGEDKCEWHTLWSWDATDTLVQLFGSCSTGMAAPVPQLPPARLEAMLVRARARFDAARAALHASGVLAPPLPLTDAAVAAAKGALGPVISSVARSICAPSGEVDLKSPLALKALVEKLYSVGLLAPGSPLKDVEEPYVLLRIRAFQRARMCGRAKATEGDVRAFFRVLIETKDPLATDLVHHSVSHMGRFVRAASGSATPG